ncbi:MAG: TonB-dependent receptor [Candidatus Hatepunaea meridiana]|nr:TonB-dependent receptor [Candidatus Hatepunaea meridiana]
MLLIRTQNVIIAIPLKAGIRGMALVKVLDLQRSNSNLFIVIILLLMWSCDSDAVSTGVIEGKVIASDTGSPIQGANVILKGTSLGAATDLDGRFRIASVPGGTYTVVVSHLGYVNRQRNISINNIDVKAIVFRLTPMTLQMDEVVFTATRTEKALKDVPILTELITANQMQTAGAVTASDALEWSLPSVDIRPGSMGSEIKMHGLSNEYVLFLVDGERIAGETKGNIDYLRLNISDMARIEVVKGASSSLYGSNAISGVVNIISKKPRHSLEMEAVSGLSRFGEKMIGGSLGLRIGEIGSRTSINHRSSNGYDLTPETPNSMTQESFECINLKQSFEYNLYDKTNIGLNVAYYDYERFDSSTKPYHPRNYGLSYGTKVNHTYSSDNSLEVSWHSDRYEKFDVMELLDNDERLTYRHRYNNGRVLGNVHSGSKQLVTIGSEYIGESLFSTRIADEDQSTTNWVVFLQDDISFTTEFMAVTGLRIDHHSAYGIHLTPKVSLMYKLLFFNLRAGYGAGFRAPTLKELYMDFDHFGMFRIYGNPDLKPETSHYFSGSVEYSKPRINASVSMYCNELKNMIQELESPDEEKVINYRNVGRVSIFGMDVLVKRKLRFGFSIGGGYSFVDTKDNDTGLELGGVIRHSGRVKLEYAYTRNQYDLTVNLQGKLTGRRYYEYIIDETGAVRNDNLAPYALWKLTVIHRLFSTVDLTLGIDNLFDYTDRLEFSTLDPGRRYFASLNIHYNLNPFKQDDTEQNIN